MENVEPLNSCQIHSNPPLIRLCIYNINIHFYSYPMYFHFIPRKGAKMIVTMLDVTDKNPRNHLNSPSSQMQYVMASALVVGRQVSQRHKVFFWGERACGIIKGVTKCSKIKSNKKSLLKSEKWRPLFELMIKGVSSRYVRRLAPRKQWRYVRAHVQHQALDAGSLKFIDLRAISACRSPVLHPNAVETKKKTRLPLNH